jgi:hypothetical protein
VRVRLPVTIGPRNRRRLATGAAIAGAIAAVVLAVLPTRSTLRPGHAVPVPGHGLSAFHDRCVPTPTGGCVFDFDGIGSGMTKAQVQRVVGKPATKRGRCWRYPQQPNQARVHNGIVKSVLDVCFFGGRVSDRSTQGYVRRHGKVVPLRCRLGSC